MRIFKYLFAVWTAIAVYILFSFLGGPRGIPAYNYLLSEKEQQLNNIKELEIINDELERTKNNLLYDYDTLLVYAHQMGYAYDDERFVRIVGLGNIKNNPAVTGKVYIAQYPYFITDKNIKIAALCAGILVFVFLLIFDLIDSRSR
jgi:cell division protein FtsB